MTIQELLESAQLDALGLLQSLLFSKFRVHFEEVVSHFLDQLLANLLLLRFLKRLSRIT